MNLKVYWKEILAHDRKTRKPFDWESEEGKRWAELNTLHVQYLPIMSSPPYYFAATDKLLEGIFLGINKKGY